MAEVPDMEFRDHNNLNGHIQIQFEDVFGEPEGIRSLDCIWRCSYRCFNMTLGCCYKFLTALCALPIAVCWACQYACLACCHVWYVTPYINFSEMTSVPIHKLYTICLNTYCSPLCETCGLCFSKIRVKTDT